MNLAFNSRAMQRKHGTEEEGEYAAHDAVRGGRRGRHHAGARHRRTRSDG